MAKYAIGVDFGTLAVRALIVEVSNGGELACASFDYPHGVMSESLPDGTPLKPDWALQHPLDYWDGIRYVVRRAVEQAGIPADDIIGLGIDFTSSTSLPVDESGIPLCLKRDFSSNPWAWPMLWKHHAAQVYANRMTEAAQIRQMRFLGQCGGRISSEMMFPRLWQIRVEAPNVYQAADCFMEAGDWITRQLTGSRVCSANPAMYKLFWAEDTGYPPRDFFEALDPGFSDVLSKVSHTFLPLGSRAGILNQAGAEATGLIPGTPVSVTCIDAHTAIPAAGVAEGRKLVLTLGTSAAHVVLDQDEHRVKGLLCMARDGIIPGWYAYEAGQSCCGDHFGWFVDQFARSDAAEALPGLRTDLHALFSQKAARLQPGESGLLALDWWNGNRSVLMNANLSGLILGLSLQTRPEEIYRALIEATAYGSRVILENFESSGIPVNEVYVCGGIAKKNPLLMQIYADVLKRKLHMVRSEQANALGAAIFAAVAAGKARGGYDSIREAARAMGGTGDLVYEPCSESSRIYDELYVEYRKLHDYFGAENPVMRHLKEISLRSKSAHG